MFLKTALAGAVCAMASAAGAGTIHIQKLDLAGAVTGPKTDFEVPGHDPRTGYVLDLRSGRIDRYDRDTGAVDAVPYLDGITASEGQMQAFGLAFHPDFASAGAPGAGKVYVSYAENSGRRNGARNLVVEYTEAAGRLEAPRVVLRVAHGPAAPTAAGLHLGSDIGFGPDGHLYVTLGDAGGPPEGPNVAQDFAALAGSVLRFDPLTDAYPGDPDRNFTPASGAPAMGAGADPAIWAGGLRNPFRATFDALTGAYYIGDVGERTREEINLGQEGANYGWPYREGAGPGPDGSPAPGGLIDPIYEYGHGTGPFEGDGVVGGVVYRGALTALFGEYLFGDLANLSGGGPVEAIWSFDADAPGAPADSLRRWRIDAGADELNGLLSFSAAPMGDAYLLDFDGDVFRVSAVAVPLPAGWATLGAGLALIGAVRKRRN